MGQQDARDRRNRNNIVTLEEGSMKAPEAFAPAGTYPVTYDAAAVGKGDSFRITGDGTMGAVTVNPEDLLIALVDAPGQIDGNWQVVESNRDQATETVKGVARLATAAEITAGVNAIAIVTPVDLEQKIAAIPSGSMSSFIPSVRVRELIGNATIAVIDGLSGEQVGDAYVATDAGTPAVSGSELVAAGDLIEFSGPFSGWKVIVANSGGFPPVGTRAILAVQTALISPYTDSTDDGKVVLFDGTDLIGVDTTEAASGIGTTIEEPSILNGLAPILNKAVPGGTWSPGSEVLGKLKEVIQAGASFTIKPFTYNIMLADGGTVVLPPLASVPLGQCVAVFAQATGSSTFDGDGTETITTANGPAQTQVLPLRGVTYYFISGPGTWVVVGSEMSQLIGDPSADRFIGSLSGELAAMTPQQGDALGAAEVTLTDQATIDYDVSAGKNAVVTLAGNRVLDFTNVLAGQRGVIQVIQSGGSNTLTYSLESVAGDVDFAGGSAPTLSAGAGDVDLLEWYCTGPKIILKALALDVS